MLITSGIISRGSGSFGGITLAHNAGGMYLRARVMPVNPSTPAQNLVRAAAASLVNRWSNTLTQAQRDAWDSYAFNTPLIGKLGDPINVSGLNMYVRGNLTRQYQAMTLCDDAPFVWNLGSFTPLASVTADTTLQEWKISYTNTDDWAGEDDAWLVGFISRPTNATINFFKGPYRIAGMVEGDSITPPTSPLTLDFPFTVASGQRVFARCCVLRADGRMSNDQLLTDTAAPV